MLQLYFYYITAASTAIYIFLEFPFTLPRQALVFTWLHYTSFENTVGKGEIAHYEQFLLFTQRFLPFWRTFCHFDTMFSTAFYLLVLQNAVLSGNGLTNEKSLEVTKFKTAADHKLNVAKLTISPYDRVENSVRKGANDGNQHFLHFLQCFPKALFFWVVKSLDCVVKSSVYQ